MTDEQRKILLVEDDLPMRRVMRDALIAEGFRVAEAEGVEAGWGVFQTQSPDIAVLDLGLPDGDGRELCRRIRGHKSMGRRPVIILTARSEIEDKAEGFGAGADQYLVKPVDRRELLLWIRALLRRLDYDVDRGGELRAGPLAMDPSSQLVRYGEAMVTTLTSKEFDLLYLLVRKRPRILTRQQILSELWDEVVVDNTVDVHMGRLRRKLPAELVDKIQSLPGRGFRFLE